MNDLPRLGARDGLPRDLLFLTDKHPRGTWRGKPGLAGTGQIWLANHDHFRATVDRIARSLAALRETGETTQDSAPALRRHISGLLGGLEGHHTVEDHHYFPMFRRAEPRLLRGFQILDADHDMIHAAIDDLATATQDSLRRMGQAEGVMTGEQKRAVEDLAAVVNRIAPLLRQHLADEEDIVIPLILERAAKDPKFG